MPNLFQRVFRIVNTVLHPEYRIWPDGRDELVYREGNRRVTIRAEYGGDERKGGIQIDGCSFVRWDAPHDDELISEEKRQQILNRLLEDIKKKDKCHAWVVYDEEREKREREKAARLRTAKNTNIV